LPSNRYNGSGAVAIALNRISRYAVGAGRIPIHI
jgi:hypothetical protein